MQGNKGEFVKIIWLKDLARKDVNKKKQKNKKWLLRGKEIKTFLLNKKLTNNLKKDDNLVNYRLFSLCVMEAL